MAKEEAAKNRAFRRKCMFAGIFLAACLLLVFLQKVKEEKEKKRLTFSLAGEEEASKEDVSRELLEEEKESVLEEPKVREVEKETLGIDVSRFQEEIDWAQVAEAGIDFAMVRIGCRGLVSGAMVEDDRAAYNLREASENGIYVGAYFFSTAVNEEEVREEAQWVCSFLEDYVITYPVVYNCEGFQEETSRQYGMTSKERTALAQIFLDEIEAAGYMGMFYGAKGELQDSLCWDTEALEARYRIWVAQYLEETYPERSGPEYEGACDMWQYTDQARVPGIRTVVDQNVAYFGFEEEAVP